MIQPKHEASDHYEMLQDEGGRWTLSDNEAEISASVPAVRKAIQILSFLNFHQRPALLSLVSDATKITKSHCYGILRTLSHFGWVTFNPEHKTYALSVGILKDVSSVLPNLPAWTIISPILSAIPASTGTSCILSIPSMDEGFIVVGKANAQNQLEISYPAGHRFPRDSSAQMKALLAWASPEYMQRWFEGWTFKPYTPAAPASLERVVEELEVTRNRGYARSVDEFTMGISAIALPIFDEHGQVAFILDCVGLTGDIARKEPEIASALKAAVAQIHRSTAATPPADFLGPKL